MHLDLTHTWVGYLILVFFVVGYYFIAREEKYRINKAKPALFIWTTSFLLIWIYFALNWYDTHLLNEEIEKLIVEISQIFFFLLVAMTYIEVMVDRWVFDVLRKKLIHKWYTYKKLFWVVWLIAFFLSPIADNLTTALILSTVVIAISNDKKFIVASAINIVVAANAWWAWSPFWDITTLMAWTEGKADFLNFLTLFPAAFLWWLTTAWFLSMFLPKWKIDSWHHKDAHLKLGSKIIIWLWILTIVLSIISHQFLHLPAMWGMMFWLSLLQLFSYRLKVKHWHEKSFNIFHSIKKTEIDTLIFFFWILAAVWSLDFIWYLKYITNYYELVWVNAWNISVWILSAIIDNIPVMSAVLKSPLEMDLAGWLMLTLTVWIWGSLISFGSAAWVGVMAKMKWIYTFNSHMKFFPIILIWYIVSIGVFYIQFYYLGWY